MPLILAIEPDHRQASQLRAIARGRLGADLVHAESAGPALIALGGRVPDLILMPALLSPADEAAIGDYLRVLDAASSHVQTLIIPVLAANRPRSSRRGVLASLKRQQAPAPEGCDPKEFAEQCATYLERAAAERERRAEAEADAAGDALAVQPVGEPPVEAALEGLVEFVAELQVEPVIESPVVDAPAEPVVERLAVPAVESPAALADQEVLELVAEPAVDEDLLFEIMQPARELEFIELDLSPLLDELSGPNLAIPAELPARTAAVENTVMTAPSTLAALEIALAVVPAAEPVEVEKEPEAPVVTPLRCAVKWTAVYSPPGRWWPSMEGVAAEAESPASQPAPTPRAGLHSIAPRKAEPKAIQDEWGFFDPTRCGFTALLSKLDEITTAEEAPLKQRA